MAKKSKMFSENLAKGMQEPTKMPATMTRSSLEQTFGKTPAKGAGRGIEDLSKAVAEVVSHRASKRDIQRLEPSKCEPSFIRDRMNEENDEEFQTLKQAIDKVGQQSPILVRPHPVNRDVYQIAYGHRRWRACAELDIAVNAVVKELTDEQLLISQGQENHERKNLSFIETAMFAEAMRKDYHSGVIMEALGIGKSTLSQHQSVTRAISPAIIRAIGPAPKTGRPKWTTLAKQFGAEPLKCNNIVQGLSTGATWVGSSSDQKFDSVMEAIAKGQKVSAQKIANTPVEASDGTCVVTVSKSKTGAKFSWQGETGRDFSLFVADRMQELLADFEKSKETER